MTCANCPKRETCTELCERALEYIEPERFPEEFVRQYQEDPEHWPVAPGSKKYQIAVLYFIDGWTEQRIAEHFSVTQPYVSKIVMRVKRFMAEL